MLEHWKRGSVAAWGRYCRGLWPLALVWAGACGAHGGAKLYGELADLPSFPAAQHAKVWIVADNDGTNAAIRGALGSQLEAEGVDVLMTSTRNFSEALARQPTIPSDVVVLVTSAKLRTARIERADQHTKRSCRSQLGLIFTLGALVGTVVAMENAQYACKQKVITDRYALFETEGALVMTLRAASGETLALKELRSVVSDRRSYPSAQVVRSLVDQAVTSVHGFHQRYEARLLPLDDTHGLAAHEAALAGDWAAAARHYELALQDPAVAGDRKASAMAHHNLAQALVFQCAGTREALVVRALEHARLAKQLDAAMRPTESWIAQRLQRLRYAAARRKEQATQALAALAVKSPPTAVEPPAPTVGSSAAAPVAAPEHEAPAPPAPSAVAQTTVADSALPANTAKPAAATSMPAAGAK